MAITKKDILPNVQYLPLRDTRRSELTNLKKNRRVFLGEWITILFENRETLLFQIQEMLFIEKNDSDTQIKDELDAYAPLEPSGNDLVITLMVEISDPHERAINLKKLVGLENHIVLKWQNHCIQATSESFGDGSEKTFSVHFMKFKMTEEQKQSFLEKDHGFVIECTHPAYERKVILQNYQYNAIKMDLSN
jgi:hypothetical protein